MTDLPKISDEMVEDHARAVFAVENTVHTWDGCSESARQSYRDEARLHLTALVASGYRREADVRAAIAFEIRAELVCCDIYELLSKERDERRWRTEQTKGHHLCYWGEAAARIAESHELRTLGQATALEQALPLLAAGLEGQERSEGGKWCDDEYAGDSHGVTHTCGLLNGHAGSHLCRCTGLESYTWPAGASRG